MSPLEIGLLGIGVMFVLLLAGMPVGFSMAIVGVAGFAAISGWNAALGTLKIVPFSTMSSYSLSVIPLFILMGNLAFHGGLSADLYETARSWLGRMKGGLAMSSIAACAGFAALSGSSIATAATMGKIAIPEMKRHEYDDRLTMGSCAAGGTIGILIPPSVVLIVYGILTEQSIGKLFLAGFIPGILQALFYIGAIAVWCYFRPKVGPAGPQTTFREKIISLKGSWMTLILFLLVIGGLYLGVFSTVEAAGIGAFGAFIFALARRKLNMVTLKDSLVDTVKTSAMIFLIVIGANIFGYFLAVSGVPQALSDSLSGLPVNRYVILVMVIIIYLFLGCIMDTMAMVLLTVPIFFPLILALGFNPIWFGIIVTRVAEIGMITPPVGMNLYVLKGIAPDVSMGTIARGVIPFMTADLLHVILMVAVPWLVLVLPSVMQGT